MRNDGMRAKPGEGSLLERSSSDPRAEVLEALRDGPKSCRELECDTGFLRAMAGDGLVTLDPDRFPDQHVPGNPLIGRLPGDTRPWPGWSRWNV